MFSLHTQVQKLTREEAEAALRLLQQREYVSYAAHENFWVYWTVWYALRSHLQAIGVEEWLVGMGYQRASAHRPPTLEELQVQPLHPPRGLIFPSPIYPKS